MPKLLDEIRLAPNAYHLVLHQAYRERCFPHPETGLTVREAETPPAAVANQALPFQMVTEATAPPYPFKWNPSCQISYQVAAKVAETPATIPKTTQKASKTKPATAQKTSKPAPTSNKTERKKQRELRQTARQQRQQQRTLAPLVQGVSGAVGNSATKPPPPTTTVSAKKPTVAQQVYTTVEGETILPTIVSTSAGGDIPIYFEDAPRPQAHSTTGIIDNQKKKRRVAVTVSDTVSLKDGSNNVAVSATWSPKKDWFVNGSASVKDGNPVTLGMSAMPTPNRAQYRYKSGIPALSNRGKAWTRKMPAPALATR